MRRIGGWRAVLLSAGGLALAATGCHNFVEEITRRDFRVKHLFVDPDPMTVLRESKDGDERAKALRQVKEPSAVGGGEELQKEVMQHLTDAAINEPRPLCRLAAIEALGRFNDPAAPAVLLQAYQKASDFPTDAANPIRCEAMTALGKKNSAEGLALLAKVAATARSEAPKGDVRLTSHREDDPLLMSLGHFDPDKQAARDARLAAVRALGASKNPQAVGVLIPLLEEPDVALRDRAYEALQAITGRKDLPPDEKAWTAAMGQGAGK